jgi:hypothetical protein
VLKLVQFNCGCIGTRPNEKGEFHLFYDCRQDETTSGRPDSISVKKVNGNDYQVRGELSEEAVSEVLNSLNHFMMLGQTAEMLRSELGFLLSDRSKFIANKNLPYWTKMVPEKED